MAKASLIKQLKVEADNKVGTLADVSGAIAETGVNITAICGYGIEGKAFFYIVTSDNTKVISALSQKGYKVGENEVVAVKLEDKVGQAKEIANKIKAAGIDLEYIYGSTCGCADTQALLVINSKENAKVVSAING